MSGQEKIDAVVSSMDLWQAIGILALSVFTLWIIVLATHAVVQAFANRRLRGIESALDNLAGAVDWLAESATWSANDSVTTINELIGEVEKCLDLESADERAALESIKDGSA